ncbi:fatty acid desaturase [Paraburkholderia unamae]|uniref:Fatty acid desaturase n=1 Tax=Paraburkholderia unamae TaxID=219649 RepID=A0ABX5KE86_9BURK|nr:fatty acid desaturase [Paraburkholderia unamae]PVX73146.1 fatty acid desaturase [Paraburkholderia unamae]RAR52673.1 fatty acid desaturase [Paraburkholderia unamae]
MAEYFDVDHAREIASLATGFTARTEWPTWLLIGVIYGGWAGVLALLHAGHLTLAAATPPLVVLCAWHMSLQHELMHGHPTRLTWLNAALGWPPLAVWFPYALYRESHMAHHRDEALTMPGIDPETNYVLPGRWTQLPRWQRVLWLARKSFVGRMVIGPPMSVAAMLRGAAGALQRGERRHLPMWLAHLAAVTLLLACVQRYAGVPWWYYLAAITWPALGLAMVRSLYEHRAAAHPKARIAINEAGPVMRLLYLNNNYHLVHHDLPGLAWFHLPRAYRMRREDYRRKCGGFVIGGYAALLRRYAWRVTDAPAHPFGDSATR